MYAGMLFRFACGNLKRARFNGCRVLVVLLAVLNALRREVYFWQNKKWHIFRLLSFTFARHKILT